MMNSTSKQDQRIAKMTFASIYPYYFNKIEKKNRTKDELQKVIEWLTGFNFKELEKFIDQDVAFETFFMNATLNKNAHLITGTICGIKIEEIKNPITKQVRYLDKLSGQTFENGYLDPYFHRDDLARVCTRIAQSTELPFLCRLERLFI